MPSAFGDSGAGGSSPPLPAEAVVPSARAAAEARARPGALRRPPSGIVKEPFPGRRSTCLCEPPGMESRGRVDLPPYVSPPFEVFVNGVPQAEGADYELVGRSLLFTRSFAREGKLGFWRWLSMLLGIAGTYRKHDTIDVAFTIDGRRKVVGLAPVEDDTASL